MLYEYDVHTHTQYDFPHFSDDNFFRFLKKSCKIKKFVYYVQCFMIQALSADKMMSFKVSFTHYNGDQISCALQLQLR